MCYEKYTKMSVVTILDLYLWWEKRLGQATFGQQKDAAKLVKKCDKCQRFDNM